MSFRVFRIVTISLLVVHYLFTFRDDGPFKERKIKSDQIIYQD